jgi:diguanylate cyclase
MHVGREFLDAKQLAEQAVAAMVRHRVPPTPHNYAVWYAHVAGSVGELSAAIEQTIASGGDFTADRNEQLHKEFIAEDDLESVQRAGEHLSSTLSKMMSYIEAAAGDTRAYNARLDAYSEKLGAKPTLEGLKQIVGDLAAETGRVLDQSRRLESQLVHSSGEITQLRENLATVQREAMTDALTGIPNRKYFERLLPEVTDEATRSGVPLSMLFIDIDHFKKFNDTFGHQLGDEVLRLVARTLMECVKGRDIAARYGGEEFAILLPQTKLKDGAAVAEQIRSTLVRRRLVHKRSRDQLGFVTVSIGVSEWRPGESAEEFVQRSDTALYHAKGHGRNRVATEDDCAGSAAA